MFASAHANFARAPTPCSLARQPDIVQKGEHPRRKYNVSFGIEQNIRAWAGVMALADCAVVGSQAYTGESELRKRR